MSEAKNEVQPKASLERVVRRFISGWEDLAEVEDSETHRIEIEEYCGWIVNKETGDLDYYLSTHTFYGNKYKISEKALQKYWFNLELRNWDA